MNPYDDGWQNQRLFRGNTQNVSATLSSASVDLSLAHAGWWRIHSNVGWHGAGPDDTYAAVATSTGQHIPANAIVEIYVDEATKHVAAIREGSVSGTIYASLFKGL